jgi:serine/threonine protein phosphatase PrpC
VLDSRTGVLRYISAAHPGLVHHPVGGTPQIVENAGFAVGWFADAEWDEYTLQLSPGDRFYLCSDGVTKHLNDTELSRLLAGAVSAEQRCAMLIERANGSGGTDNMTAVVASFQGA